MNALLQRACFVLSRTAPVWSTALVLAALVAMILLPAQQASRERAVSFDGVIERKELGGWDSKYGSRIRYSVIVRQRTGETVRFRVTRLMYERARVGMRARKAAGEQWPHIGEAAAAP